MSRFAVDLGELSGAAGRLAALDKHLAGVEERLRKALWQLADAAPDPVVREPFRQAWVAIARAGESTQELHRRLQRSLTLYLSVEVGLFLLDAGLARAADEVTRAGRFVWNPLYPHLLDVLGNLGGRFGLAGGLVERSDRIVTVIPLGVVPGPAEASDPASIADLIAGDAWLDGQPGQVRVLEVPQPDGGSGWIVQIPGTQEWWPYPEENPFDLTTNARAMAGQVTGAATGVALALAAAQQARGRQGRRDPVLLTGHSQGGILAAYLAADPAFRAQHDVRAVVTAGSPVNRFPVPATTPVLSIEHTQDVVPRLDGVDAPQRAGLVSVVVPLAGVGALASHDGSRYRRTAEVVDELPGHRQPGLSRWRAAARPFLRGGSGVVVRDYRIERGWQNPRS